MKQWKYINESKKRFSYETGERLSDEQAHYIFEGDKLIAVLAHYNADPKDFSLIASAPEMFEALTKIKIKLSGKRMAEFESYFNEELSAIESALRNAGGN